MTTWERMRELSTKLHAYGRQHSYTDWEAEQVDAMVQDLTLLAVVVEDELKQTKRTVGGLTNKVRVQGETIKKLEERLEELEAENTKLKAH